MVCGGGEVITIIRMALYYAVIVGGFLILMSINRKTGMENPELMAFIFIVFGMLASIRASIDDR
jgi:hypothetical protein